MDIDTKTEQELYDLIEEAKNELARRQTLQAVDEEVATVLRNARASGAIPTPSQGAEWVQPTSAVDSYVEGDTVVHNGKRWISLVSANVWEPGISSWREAVAPGAAPPDWVQPSGATDSYNTGDLVTFEGAVYKSVIDANTWSPADYPQGWELQ